jgi:hypothetical protein
LLFSGLTARYNVLHFAMQKICTGRFALYRIERKFMDYQEQIDLIKSAPRVAQLGIKVAATMRLMFTEDEWANEALPALKEQNDNEDMDRFWEMLADEKLAERIREEID